MEWIQAQKRKLVSKQEGSLTLGKQITGFDVNAGLSAIFLQ